MDIFFSTPYSPYYMTTLKKPNKTRRVLARSKRLPSTKIAILIDGGFFVKRFNRLYNRDKTMNGADVAQHLYNLAFSHVEDHDILYRIFYYDCWPLEKKMHNPVDNKVVDFSKTYEYQFRSSLINELKKKRKVAIRIGTLKTSKEWHLQPKCLKDILKGNKRLDEITPEDVYLDMRQKGIDMKIGVDIASLAMKRFVDRIVLFSGDSDFVPASKLARREGVDFVLDPMESIIEPELFEHIDGVHHSTQSYKGLKKK